MEQITIEEYLTSKEHPKMSCGQCICRKCLYWWSGRCQHGRCYDDFRAQDDPYDKAHPGRPPRTFWSDWNKPGERAHWCRGGDFFPVSYCEHYVRYEDSTIEGCIRANVQIFQDGYMTCVLKDSIGCAACAAGKNDLGIYNCRYMTDSGCERMIAAKNLMLDDIAGGADIEMCREQCCMRCTRLCGYRCGQAYARNSISELN